MWQRLKEQIPTIVVMAVLITGGAAILFNRIASRQRVELAVLQTQNDRLREQADENRQQVQATNQLLKDALKRTPGSMLGADAPIESLNEERLTRLADLIATRIEPRGGAAKSPAEVEQMQSEETNRIATRLTNNLRPMLTTAVAKQDAALADAVREDQRRIDQLNGNVRAIQAAAQDAIKLTHELSARYLDTFQDHGVLVRVLSLPAELIQDTVKLDLVNSRDRAKVDRELSARMNDIEKRLREMQEAAGKS